jgi:hypothetical protein
MDQKAGGSSPSERATSPQARAYFYGVRNLSGAVVRLGLSQEIGELGDLVKSGRGRPAGVAARSATLNPGPTRAGDRRLPRRTEAEQAPAGADCAVAAKKGRDASTSATEPPASATHSPAEPAPKTTTSNLSTRQNYLYTLGLTVPEAQRAQPLMTLNHGHLATRIQRHRHLSPGVQAATPCSGSRT